MFNVINIDIILLIFNKLYYKDKFNFIKINKYIYNICDINQYKVFYYLNNNYELFYKYIDNYYLNQIEVCELLYKSIKNINHVYKYNRFTFYDMRFLFEILFKYEYRLSNDVVYSLNLHFYINFYKHLLNCICYNNRSYTKKNINNNKFLISLHKNTKLYNKHSSIPLTELL